MDISIHPIANFPYGANIHFAFEPNTRRFLFVHPSVSWAVADEKGISADALISKLQPEDIPAFKETIEQVIAGAFEGTVRVRLDTDDGIRWIQITPFLITQDGKDLLIGMASEITAEVVSQQSVEKFANKKNSILYIIGHDLRGPLNMATSVLKAMERDITDTVLLKKTQYIANVLSQSINLISDLIKREFIENMEVVLVKKRVNIIEKISEYLEECRRSEAITDRIFELTSSSDKIIVNVDEPKFMQVVNNLMSNSLKFTRPGCKITISITEEQDMVRFTFADDGIGIPKSMLPKIFDKYSDAGRPGLQGEATLGLGLSLVKIIVEWHHGKISCESEEGKGTAFYVCIPKTEQ